MGEGSSFNDIAKKLDRTASAVEKLRKSFSGAQRQIEGKTKPVADPAPQPEKASITTRTRACEQGQMMKWINDEIYRRCGHRSGHYLVGDELTNRFNSRK